MALVLAAVSLPKADPVRPPEPEGISINLDIFSSPAEPADQNPDSVPDTLAQLPAMQPPPKQSPPKQSPPKQSPRDQEAPVVTTQKKSPEEPTTQPETPAEPPIYTAPTTNPQPVTKTITSDVAPVKKETRAIKDPSPIKDKKKDEGKPVPEEQPQQAQVTLVAISSTVEVPAVAVDNTLSDTNLNTTSSNTGTTENTADSEAADIEYASYSQAVRMAVLAQRSYPQRARRKQLTGTVVVAFRVSADGMLQSTRIIASSGHPILDRAAVSAVDRVGRFTPFPDDINRLYWDFEVPVVFR
jgi:protein TonB